MQFAVTKSASASKAVLTDADMEAINRQTMNTLTTEQVYIFRCEACNNAVDRDFERFTLDALHGLAQLYVGKTFIMDHNWSAANQVARIFRAEVEDAGDGTNSLMVYAYLLRNDSTKDLIANIDGGILREVSVGCAMGRVSCSICGCEVYTSACSHIKGSTYDGKTCVYELSEPLDAYEVSFVAVPAQPRAGVKKSTDSHGWTPAEIAARKAMLQIERMKYHV